MRDTILFGLILGLCSMFAHSQSFGPYSLTGSQCAAVRVDSQATAALQVLGSWSGTIQPKASVAGQAAVNVQVAPAASATKQSTITANGAFIASAAGYNTFLVCGNTITGTATIYINVSPFIH